MELFGYILKIAQLLPDLEEVIKKDTINILSLFIFNSHLSVYKIYKILEKKDKKISYKNTHKKIQRLVNLQLIEKIPDESISDDKELKRGAIYYKLSEVGIFVLFYDSSLFIQTNDEIIDEFFKNDPLKPEQKYSIKYIKEFNKYYGNCNFFKLFLFPWISQNTIENLNWKMELKIRRFLTDCCNIIKDSYLYFTEYTSLSSELIDLKDDIYEIDRRRTPLLYLIKLAFDIEIKSVKVKRINEYQIIISKPDDTKLVKLIYKEKEEEGKKKKEKELDIISYINIPDKITLQANSISEVRIPHNFSIAVVDKVNLEMLYYNAVFSVMIEADNDFLELLKEDNIFMEKASEVNKTFTKSYEALKNDTFINTTK